MPFTDGARFKTNPGKYKHLIVKMMKDTKNAKLYLKQGDKVIAAVDCSNCRAGQDIKVPLQGANPMDSELFLQGAGEMHAFDITTLAA